MAAEKPAEGSRAAGSESGAERVEPKPAGRAIAAAQENVSYPVNISPMGEIPPQVDVNGEPNGAYTVTVIGRLYVWQKQRRGPLLELQADNAVIWYQEGAGDSGQGPAAEGGLSVLPAGGAVRAVYVSGDVEFTEGPRTVRARELYYDFEQNKALMVESEMRTFDVKRGIPIYVRAARLRQLAKDKFSAEDVTLTSSEFYLPQLSVNASSILVTDTTAVDEYGERVSDSSYDAQMHDVCFKVEDTTIFYWPYIRSNLQRPDTALKSVHAGYDSDWGAILETRWYLWRLLGLPEPEGTKSTLAVDYYSDRGAGVGVEAEYEREDYFGRLIGYVINDRGEDDLGRDASRRNLAPPRELRGRFRWQHRQFLPYSWQLTTEISYLSDENFLEGYYRNEFNVGKDQETLAHLKRTEDNWGLSFLGKVRINDFVDELEELPSVEHHLTGQSLWGDRLTFYSDSQVSRFRQRVDSGLGVSEDFFTFMYERAEIGMPTKVGRMRLVPYLAGTVAYDDGGGFHTDLDGETVAPEDCILTGELGVRASTQYWNVYPDAKSRLWDLNQLRHIISPYAVAAGYADTESAAEQRDTLSLGISQRLQTKRGLSDSRRTVDWMRLDTAVTWVNDSGDTSGGPSRLIWNKPFIPVVNTINQGVPPQDRRSTEVFGPRRNYLSADYIWRVSDTTAVLSDLNFDMQSGVVQQFNIGFSRLVWPNLSYYVGSRYLRRVENGLGEKGSNVFTLAATYVLDPRYTVVFSQQFDFDYGASIHSDIALVRRYHRIYWGITYSADESLDKQAIVFSIWPQGVPEIGIGPRRYLKVGESVDY